MIFYNQSICTITLYSLEDDDTHIPNLTSYEPLVYSFFFIQKSPIENYRAFFTISLNYLFASSICFIPSTELNIPVASKGI